MRPAELNAGEALAEELGLSGVRPLDLESEDSIHALIRAIQPEIVYHLAGQSSVGVSWREPAMTARVNAMGTLHLLEAIQRHVPQAAFVMAGSCDCYNHEAAPVGGITPESPFKVTNPYAASKVMAHQLTQCFRAHNGLRASVAVLFNHTSPRRAEMFVERGIVRGAVKVALGLERTVTIGDMATRRDWSWAEDVVEGFMLMGTQREPRDFVLASGVARTVGHWVHEAFEQLGLDIEKHLTIDRSRLHSGDRPHEAGNIEPAKESLGWEPRVGFKEMVRLLIEHDRVDLRQKRKGVRI